MTVQNTKNRTETGQTTGQTDKPKPLKSLPRTHVDYWKSKLKKRSYRDRQGNVVEIPEWQVRLFHAGKEEWFNLQTANAAVASVKARDIYDSLRGNGWEATKEKFKRDSEATPRINLTCGDYLAAVDVLEKLGKLVRKRKPLRLRSLLGYKNGFRTVVSEVFGIRSEGSKYDYRAGGNQRWIERIDAIRLERVTPARVDKWKLRRIKEAGKSRAAIETAQRTCNSYIRCARCLFTRSIREHLKKTGITLPTVGPFDGVELFDNGDCSYKGTVRAETLIAAAKAELKATEPECYKVFLLGLFAGMRKGEIDYVEWRMVDFVNHVIKLEETEFLRLKTESSKKEITVDEEVTAELRDFMASSTSPFVITSSRPPRNDSARTYYRCDPVFNRLNEWLRSKGVKANKPIHDLRKEIGAKITTTLGIYAASQFLRHADITTTARFYAKHQGRISTGLGKLLDTEIKPVAAAEGGVSRNL